MQYERLQADFLACEKSSSLHIGRLTRYKDISAAQIASLQQQQLSNVPREEIDTINRSFSLLAAKYRALLEATSDAPISGDLEQRFLVSEDAVLKASHRADAAEQMIQLLKTQLSEAMKSDKLTNLLSRQGDVNQDSFQVLQQRALNDCQRADLLVLQLERTRQTSEELHNRNKHLESKVVTQTDTIIKAQETEKELRDILAGCVSELMYSKQTATLCNLEVEHTIMKSECDRLKDVAMLAIKQVDMIRHQNSSKVQEQAALQSQLLDLQAVSDETAQIGILHGHLLALQVITLSHVYLYVAACNFMLLYRFYIFCLCQTNRFRKLKLCAVVEKRWKDLK